MEETLISVPLPWSRMTRSAARAPWTYPITLTSRTLRMSSSGVASVAFVLLPDRLQRLGPPRRQDDSASLAGESLGGGPAVT
ncbi:MAG TPA: hypothetical protein VK545_07415 [Streptomyces sp.]|nr:hypothetical protein [Streptomyces sp.]